MRAVRLFGVFAALAALTGCNVQPGVEYDLGTGEQAITGGCSLQQLGAPCDPDGMGPLQECQGVCSLAAGGTLPSVRCAPLSIASGSNEGKVCGSSGFAAGNCNQVCQGALCVAKAAVDGTACRPGTATSDTLCDGQCVASGGTSTCQRITSGACTLEKPVTGSFNRDCVWDWCSATNAKSCTKVNVPSGSLCDDANACTSNERCNGSGACVATTTRTCPSSGTPCLDNKCEPSTGACIATPTTAACSFTDRCFAGVCSGGGCTRGAAISCDDGDPCTNDSCNPASGCTRTPKCPAPDACTISTCNATTGACSNVPRSCNDFNPCTDDSCNPSGGCVNAPIPGCTFVDAGVDTGTPPPVDTGVFDTGSPPPFDTGFPFDTSVEFDDGPIDEDTGAPFDTGSVVIDTGAVTDTSVEGGVALDEDLSRGGCGCRTTGSSNSTAGVAVAGLMAALIVARRRR